MEIICYLSNGYPTIEASYNMAVEYADAGCRMMEVDFPSRNPYLESDYIAGRMKKALEACDDIIKNKIIAAGLQVSCYVQFHLPKEEVEMAKQSNGFVYLQAKPYDTQQKNEEYPTLKDCVEYLRSCGIERPIYCGVGVHAPEDVRLVREAGGDAAFVGSTILKLHENIPAMKEKIREFKAMC